MIKVAFLGTPLIGAAALQSLLNHKNISVEVVITTRDKAVGRSHSVLQESPVGKLAEKNNLKIIKTDSINKDIYLLKEFEFDYILTCAFGQFLSDDILALPKYKPLNIHGSLLPKGRGGAPLHWAIINGEKKTGISIMEMVSTMDAGDYYSQYEIDITDEETVDSLFDKMSKLILRESANGLIEVHNGKKSIKQIEDNITFSMNIKSEDSEINWNKGNIEVRNQIRGLNSKPGAWTMFNGKRIKIYESFIYNLNVIKEPGYIKIIDDNYLIVQTKNGWLRINNLNFEGIGNKEIKNLLIYFKDGHKFI